MGGISVLKHVGRSVGPLPAGRGAVAAVLIVAAVITAALPASVTASERPSDPRGRYLIVLRDSGSSPREIAAEHSRRHGAEIEHVYQHALRGYAAELPAQAVEGISRDPRVAFVEPDRTVSTTSQVTPTGVARIFAPANPSVDVDQSDDIRVDVDIAIIDTGLDTQHPDLNVVSTTDCTVSTSLNVCADGPGLDDHGHGTHVAGTAAALDNGFGVVGVAPGARLHGVKVMTATGNGLMSWVVAGVDWVTARADSIEVANMSLGCRCTSVAFDMAIQRSVDRGVVHVVAAGNSDQAAAEFAPASHPDVITVSALADFDGRPGGAAGASCRPDVDDSLADFSNWGSHVEIAAPGVCIMSTWRAGEYRTLSGTSMASPHVAGVAAVLSSGANDPRDRSDVFAVRDAIINWGNQGWSDDSGDGVLEPLLDMGNSDVFSANAPRRTLGSSSPPPPGNQTPVAAFTYSCDQLSCVFDATSSSDPDGTVSVYSWDLGDGSSATGPTVDKDYAGPGLYTVRLSVTDDQGTTSTVAKEITVRDETTSTEQRIYLTGSGLRTQGTATVDLQWRGTDRSGSVVVYRNGVPIATTADDGGFSEIIEKSSGRLTYKICEEGTTNCSNEVTLW